MSRRTVAAATIVALALTGAPVRVWGQEPPLVEGPPPPPTTPSLSADDTVTLRDGTVLHGKIVEFRPERGVTITLTGGTRTIAWQDVVSTSFSGAPAKAAETRARADPEPGPASGTHEVVLDVKDELPPGPSRPRIFIESTGRPGRVLLLEATVPIGDGLARMSRKGGDGTSWSVCRAPCGRVIDGSAGNAFYFGGDRMTPSRDFFLKDLEGEYVARVRPGRPGLLYSGLFVTMFGTVGTVAGTMFLGHEKADGKHTVGGTFLGVGLALLAAGVTMLVHGTTRYRLYRRR
ncbi:hypothetical protein [Nannocystis punicea]|uniref:Uncharacterized protein n=1 Tax=Nannocystis punicea TaxID=2995304 RepID=A0ABY7H9V2_9BACT|nr:hypothetical protein [Nannocystis poenicansa]WAS95769.1 hypothetical protein O0S08_06365 [Nannocystis poenicansa]